MANGFDCATKLNATSAKALKAEGFEFVARYLGDGWKTFNADEAKAIQDAGLKLVSIFEKSPLSVGYFTKAQGIADAQEAYKYAKAVGQPVGSAIYFTVDYDAQPAHMDAIREYISGVKQLLVDYKVGLYGSYDVMQAVKGLVDYYWQTYAWSKKQVADHIHMHQYQNGVTVAWVQLDRNDIKHDPGAWAAMAQSDGQKPIMKVRAQVNTDIRTAPNHTSRYVRDAVPGEVFDVYRIENRDGTQWHLVGGDPAHGEFWIDGNNGANLYWLDNPALTAHPSPAVPQTVKVISGDTVSKIAAKYGSSIAEIKAWNNLDSKYTIYAGKKIRVK